VPALASAQPVAPAPSPLAAKVAISELSDRLGWKQPMYFSTIQAADIDGDGQDEVLGRWINGLTVYRFDRGTFVRHSRLGALSDNAGFYDPSWYSTIRAAVLDPKAGRADVVARKDDGIHVYRYDSATRAWRELGANAPTRPFADNDPTGTLWYQAKHYATIQLADITGDGAAELVGRGRDGLQVWQWQPAIEQWTPLAMSGELSDAQGFDVEAYYGTIQLADLDGDHAAELVVRAANGVRTYRWQSNTWQRMGASGPFADDAGFVSGRRHASMGVYVDTTGAAWLYGLAAGGRGPGSGTIQVSRWQSDHWEPAQSIVLPELGWDRASQASTLIAADFTGDAAPEFVVRGDFGMHAYSSTGAALQLDAPIFRDAQGWNLQEQYDTVQTMTAQVASGSGATASRRLLLGRGGKGLEVYKFDGQWQTAVDPTFPAYCATPTDGSAPCLAYQAISNTLVPGVNDIRAQYTQEKFTYDTFAAFIRTVSIMANPIGPANQAAFETVQKEMVQELTYAATVKAWFGNYLAMMTQQYNDASGLLNQAVDDVSLSTSTSVLARWLEYGGDITSAIAYVFDDEGEPGQEIGLIIEILDDIYGDLANSSGDVSEQVSKLQTQLNDQVTNYPLAIATSETRYLTDYAKLKRIGENTAGGGFDWAKATILQVQNVADAARNGMLVNFYRTLLPSKWQVYWCWENGFGGMAECGSDYTPDKFNCQYNGVTPPPIPGWTSNAYIYAGETVDVNWTLLGRLTGPLSAGTNNLNAIWYMAMLGGDLGWDLPQWGLSGTSGYLQSADPRLAYNNIKYGYAWSNTGCDGDGSTTGKLTQQTSTGQWLSVAQHNGRRVPASEANGILREIGSLKAEAEALSTTPAMQIELGSPLREAAGLVARANLAATPGASGSVSATTPTHLATLFLQRVEAHAQLLGPTRTEYLAMRAHCLVAQLQGQSPAGRNCSGVGYPDFYP